MAGSEQCDTSTPHETHADFTRASHLTLTSMPAAPPARKDASTHTAAAAAPQDHKPTWSEGGDIQTELRGRSRPPRHLAVKSPGRGAKEQKRTKPGPEYLLHRLLTSHRPRSRYPASNTDPLQTPQSHVTASVDGLVGYISSELVVLACPRLTRCLYCYKDFRCLTKRTSPGARQYRTVFSVRIS